MRISDWSSDVCSSDLEPKLLDGFHALQFADLVHYGFGDILVNGEQQNGLAARVATAKMEGADIDLRLTQSRSDTPDETGNVLIDDIKHRAFEVSFHLDARKLNQSRGLVAEQLACDRTFARGRRNRNTQQGLILDFAIMSHTATVNAATLRQDR